MKKVFYVKKDMKKDSRDNWVQMNSFDFYKFINTAEGAARRADFGQLNGK